MIMIVVSSTTMSCAPAMMTRIQRWARLVALSGAPAPEVCTAVTGGAHEASRAREDAGDEEVTVHAAAPPVPYPEIHSAYSTGQPEGSIPLRPRDPDHRSAWATMAGP